uniref:Uncharacterized protein n=1 Tax=Haptolina brevifila TaxID=156173 RepID=A0A7S2IH55_9EUKA
MVGTVRPGAAARSVTPKMMPEMAGGMQFEHVSREWRCKWEGESKTDSATLEGIAKLVDESLPAIKELDGVTVERKVCGACKDFKLIVTVPLATFGPWEEAGHPPESDFLEKLKAIDGTSFIETQTITSAML